MPACVACSIVLGSFPNNTPSFLAGAASVFAPLIFMGVYAGALFLACTVSTLDVTVSTAARVDLGP